MCVHEPPICFSPVPLQTCGHADLWSAEMVGMNFLEPCSFPSALSVACSEMGAEFLFVFLFLCVLCVEPGDCCDLPCLPAPRRNWEGVL